MTEHEYNELQKRFKNKIILYPTNKEEARNEGIRSCMSILHEVYERQKKAMMEEKWDEAGGNDNET